MKSPALKIILRAVCLAAQAVLQNLFFVMNDDIIIPLDGRKRPRPRQIVRQSYENVEERSSRSANSYFYCSITISASISVTISFVRNAHDRHSEVAE